MNHQFKQNKIDEYYTKEYAIKPILKYLKPNSKIWCPFDTEESNYVKMLTKNGHNVYFTHIDLGVDFLNVDPCGAVPSACDYIISNPPYSIREKILEHLFLIGKPFAMLINEAGLFDSKKRYELLKNNTFEIMIFDKRVDYIKEGVELKGVPFKSIYLCSNILKDKIVFETLENV